MKRFYLTNIFISLLLLNTAVAFAEDSDAKSTILNGIIPEYVKPLLEYKPGHNDSNPAWGRGGKMMGFERSQDQKKEIVITGLDGKIVKKIYYKSSGAEELDVFIPGVIEDISYNAGITWSPSGKQFVFMSNGGEGNYDLYLGSLGSNIIKRLTNHPGKDGQPHWSPVANEVVFVSGRTGKAEIFLLSLEDNKIRQLTQGKHSYLYPVWSPDGKKIVLTYGQNENHDVIIIENIHGKTKLKSVTRWAYDDLRPSWSPDGKKIAFYTNYNKDDDPKKWAIVVMDTNKLQYDENAIKDGIIARDVRPDIDTGPAWLSDSHSIVFVKNQRDAYFPIYSVNVYSKAMSAIKTETKINHDISSSDNGVFAFRAQVEQWDQIFLAKIKSVGSSVTIKKMDKVKERKNKVRERGKSIESVTDEDNSDEISD